MSDLTTVVGRHFILKDKKHTSKFFIFRMWIGYGLDATAIAIAWMEFGFHFYSDAWRIIFIVYLALLVLIGIILTIFTGWRDAKGKPDNYKWVKYIMAYFKLTSIINAGFVFFQVFSSGRRDIPAILLLTIAGIDMAMNFFEMAASLAGFECKEINPIAQVDAEKDEIKDAYDVSNSSAKGKGKGKKLKKNKADQSSEEQEVKQTTEVETDETQTKPAKSKLPPLVPENQKGKGGPNKVDPKVNVAKKKAESKKPEPISKPETKKAEAAKKPEPKKPEETPKPDPKKTEDNSKAEIKKVEDTTPKAVTPVTSNKVNDVTTKPNNGPFLEPIAEINATDQDKNMLLDNNDY